MPLVVHRLLPTNRRNHRCHRCHTAWHSVQIRHIDPRVVRSGSVWTRPVYAVTSSPSTCRSTAQFHFASGPVYAPVIIQSMRSTRYFVIPGIHGYAKIFLLLILSKGNARNCVLKDYTSNHCLWGDTKQTWSRLSILTTNTRLLSNPYFQYLTEVFRDITIRFSNHMQELLFRNIFFCHRVVESWNSLSSDIIDSDTVDSFRRRLMRIVPSGQDNFLLTK